NIEISEPEHNTLENDTSEFFVKLTKLGEPKIKRSTNIEINQYNSIANKITSLENDVAHARKAFIDAVAIQKMYEEQLGSIQGIHEEKLSSIQNTYEEKLSS